MGVPWLPEERLYQKQVFYPGKADKNRTSGLMVALNELQNVAIHNEGEDSEKEYQAHLDKALLEGNAQVAPQDSFDGQKKHVSTVQDRNWKQIEEAQVQADHRHQAEKSHGTTLRRLSGYAGNPDHALQLTDRNLAAEKAGDDLHDLAHAQIGFDAGILRGGERPFALKGVGCFRRNANLKNALAVWSHTLNRGNR